MELVTTTKRRIAMTGHWTLETIGPDTAQKYLETQAVNRVRRQARVDKIAAMMRNGHYRLTHQGIAFDTDGRLRDGQHRLHAIIAAGAAVQMWVYRGLDATAMITIDTHKPRSDADAMLIEGFDGVTHRHVAVAKRMLLGTKLRGNIKSSWDRDEMREFMERHWQAILFASNHVGCGKGFGHASIVAVIARAWYTADRDRLIEFATVLKDGVTDSADNFAAVKLRQYVTENSRVTHGSDSQRAVLYRKAQGVLRAFLERRGLTKLYECNEELFPLPEEKEPPDDIAKAG